MSKWRPEGWKECDTSEIFGEADSDREAVEIAFEAGADAMLMKVSEEIEKVENPYREIIPYSSNCGLAFERCRVVILALFKECLKA